MNVYSLVGIVIVTEYVEIAMTMGDFVWMQGMEI